MVRNNTNTLLPVAEHYGGRRMLAADEAASAVRSVGLASPQGWSIGEAYAAALTIDFADASNALANSGVRNDASSAPVPVIASETVTAFVIALTQGDERLELEMVPLSSAAMREWIRALLADNERVSIRHGEAFTSGPTTLFERAGRLIRATYLDLGGDSESPLTEGDRQRRVQRSLELAAQLA